MTSKGKAKSKSNATTHATLQQAVGWEPVLRHRVVIAGHVIDAHTNRAIPDAQIELQDMPPKLRSRLSHLAKQQAPGWDALPQRPDGARTALDGSFHFADLPSGSYQLAVAAPGYAPAERAVVIGDAPQSGPLPGLSFQRFSLLPSP